MKIYPATVYRHNLKLSQAEYALRHIYLRSQPRYMTIVIGNGCNIYCPHCYQQKNGDNLLRSAEIGPQLRREFVAMYPYLSTLRLQGGEVFALKEINELLDDISATVSRPLVSVSTNGTLINEAWAERIVRTPFQSVTVSIDGGTAATYARLRRGAQLHLVLENIGRIQRWKKVLHSKLPSIDSFYVLMRSNFREIPQYLQLMKDANVSSVAFQTMLTDQRNLPREPGLADELIIDAAEVAELHHLLQGLLPVARQQFKSVSFSGLRALFEEHGLDPEIVREDVCALYPDRRVGEFEADVGVGAEDYQPEASPHGESNNIVSPTPAVIELCPNPWNTIFVAENGDVSLCFQAAPVGNIYEQPLARIWNCPEALARRSEMISGRYRSANCSELWCCWREGQSCPRPGEKDSRALFEVYKNLSSILDDLKPDDACIEIPSRLGAVRRLLNAREQRIKSLETQFAQLCRENGHLHVAGQHHINYLERINQQLMTESGQLKRQAEAMHNRFTVRFVDRIKREWDRIRAWFLGHGG